MQIRRAVETADYVQIANDVAGDRLLSFRARGVLVFLLSMRPGVSMDSDGIAAHGREGRDAVRTALDELEARRYLIRRRLRGDRGRWRHEMIVFSRPQPAEVLGVLPQVAPATENPAAVDQASADQASADQSLGTQYETPNTTTPQTPRERGADGCAEHGPTCRRRACGRSDRQRAAQAKSAKPTHCGRCDPRTRLLDFDASSAPSRCPDCHPLSQVS